MIARRLRLQTWIRAVGRRNGLGEFDRPGYLTGQRDGGTLDFAEAGAHIGRQRACRSAEHQLDMAEDSMGWGPKLMAHIEQIGDVRPLFLRLLLLG